MSDLYNIVTISAELLLIAIVIYQRLRIRRLYEKTAWLMFKNKRLEEYVRARGYGESNIDFDGSALGDSVCVCDDDSNA